MQAQFTFLKLRRTIAKDTVCVGNKPIQELLSNRASTPILISPSPPFRCLDSTQLTMNHFGPLWITNMSNYEILFSKINIYKYVFAVSLFPVPLSEESASTRQHMTFWVFRFYPVPHEPSNQDFHVYRYTCQCPLMHRSLDSAEP